MLIIRQHRTVFSAIKILALLCLVSLNSPKVVLALSYWDALFAIGFDPDEGRPDPKAACQQIERLIKLRNAVHARPVVDKQLKIKIRQVESRISSMDAGNLYHQLPYADKTRIWRGIGILGLLDDDHYKLSIIDPEIENWIISPPGETPGHWGPQKNFGDFGLRAFIRPTNNNTFRLATEGHIDINDLNPSNMVRTIKQFATAMWLFARGGDLPPNDFYKGSTLDDGSRRVIYGLAEDFPRLFAVFNQYFIIENVVFGDVSEGAGPINFEIVVRLNIDTITKDYPYLGMLFSRFKGALDYQETWFDDQNRPLGTLAFDGDQYRFSIRFKTQAGHFLALTENSNIINEMGVDLTVSGHQRFYMNHTFNLNIAGLKLDLKALKINLDYYFDDKTANVTAKIRQTPQEITAQGLILGFLPVWLVDFFIPSNIEDLTREFFQTLATGNDGDGLSIRYGNFSKETLSGSLWFLTDAEVLANGIVKFAFNLERKMIRDEEKVLEDIRVFAQQLWKAFYLDYLRIKLLKFCQK